MTDYNITKLYEDEGAVRASYGFHENYSYVLNPVIKVWNMNLLCNFRGLQAPGQGGDNGGGSGSLRPSSGMIFPRGFYD